MRSEDLKKSLGFVREGKRSFAKEKDHKSNRVALTRLFRALVIVIVLITAPVFIDRAVISAVPHAEASETALADDVRLDTPLHSLFEDEDDSPLAVLDRIENMSRVGISEDHSALSDEIAIPPEATEFRIDPSTTLFSFEMEGSSHDVLEELASLWSLQGWRMISLGNLEGATFEKGEGVFQWMMVTCTQIGSQVCVVGNPIHS